MGKTLNEIILFCARETKREEDVVTSGGVYTEDAAVIVNRYIDGINYAKNKIIRERYKPFKKESVTTDSYGSVNLTTLSQNLVSVRAVYLSGTNTEVTGWEQGVDFTLEFPSCLDNTAIDIEYYYMIPDFPTDPTAADLAVELAFPEAIVDYKILGYYGCYNYHLIKGSDKDLEKTAYFLNLFNDGLLHIPRSIKRQRQVKDRAGY